LAKSLKIGSVAASKVVDVVLGSKGCVSSFDAFLKGSSPATAQAAGEKFRSAVDLVTGCIDSAWEALSGQNVPGAYAASVVLWLADGEKQILADGQAAIETAMHPAGYRIFYSSLPGHWRQVETLT